MPLPKSHLESLERHLVIHEEEIENLQKLLRTLSNEIRRREADEDPETNPKPEGIPGLIAERELVEQQLKTHEALLALGRDERMLETLGELIDNPGLAREASSDARGFAQARGIMIPGNMTLDLRVDESGDVSLQVAYYDEHAPFVLSWDREGFSPPRLSDELAQPGPEQRAQDA
jgi:hypothetical protein